MNDTVRVQLHMALTQLATMRDDCNRLIQLVTGVLRYVELAGVEQAMMAGEDGAAVPSLSDGALLASAREQAPAEAPAPASPPGWPSPPALPAPAALNTREGEAITERGQQVILDMMTERLPEGSGPATLVWTRAFPIPLAQLRRNQAEVVYRWLRQVPRRVPGATYDERKKGR